MTKDSWYLLKCSTCWATLRIKNEYTHMRGKCPSCGSRIPAPIPKALSFDADLVDGEPLDEEWPEPATLMSKQESEVSSYALSQTDGTTGSVTATNQAKQEEEESGVYSLAFEPDLPKTPGVTRSAEWDQSPVSTQPPTPEKKGDNKPLPPAVIDLSAPAPTNDDKVLSFKTEIDPLFGDEVKVEVKTEAPKPVQQEPAVVQPAPVARLATQEDEEDLSSSQISSIGAAVKKKKKKKTTESSPQPSSELDKPTSDTHLYRLSSAEENRVKLDEVPKALFIDGVFTFPWQPRNLPPWIWLSIFFGLIFLLFRLMAYVLESGSMMAQVGVGAIGMASAVFILFTLSYGAACWSNTITFTSAGSLAVDWSTDGWKENVVTMLRIGYYFVIAMLMSTPFLALNVLDIGTYLWLMSILFFFPLFLFSGLASLTFWNFIHEGVFKKVLAKLHHYLLMYVISLVLFGIAGVAIYFTIRFGWICLFSGPLFAAVWLIYGRLLGRMAFLLQQEPKRKKKKKKKKQPQEENSDAAHADDESVLEEMNVKGPREDARGPGGARPV
ncbi:MAG: hypothetical protein JNJ77_18355 [Planctomycetia bacterium]|nr:hypothetical protein [Planctomycetia bacterium]